MIYLKWFVLALVDWLFLLTLPVAAPVVTLVYWLSPWAVPDFAIIAYWLSVSVIPIVAALYREQPHDLPSYSWGWLWGTYDNPPQGDEGFVKKRCFFPNITTGFKGYLNRIGWMIRNPVYGYARWCALNYDPTYTQVLIGKDGISDKNGIPGWYFVRVYKAGKLVGFEFYGVFPYSFWEGRDLRLRLGWKILTEKFKEKGFAQLVNTANPFDGYNNG